MEMLTQNFSIVQEESMPTLADAVGVGAKVQNVGDVEEASPTKEVGVALIVDVALHIFEGLAVGLQTSVHEWQLQLPSTRFVAVLRWPLNVSFVLV